MIPKRFIHRSRSGLTLIELLVCVVVAGLLLTVVFSVVPTVLGRAKASRCLANMRVVGSGFLLYASDNENLLPMQKLDGLALDNQSGWIAQIFPYLESYKVLLCSESNPIQPYPNVSYGYNSFASTFSNPARKAVSLTESATPVRDILLLDTSLSGSTKSSFIITNVDAGPAFYNPHPYGGNRNGARSILFVDGHVELAPVGTLNWRQLAWPD